MSDFSEIGVEPRSVVQNFDTLTEVNQLLPASLPDLKSRDYTGHFPHWQIPLITLTK